jgi:hypothetical protein
MAVDDIAPPRTTRTRRAPAVLRSVRGRVLAALTAVVVISLVVTATVLVLRPASWASGASGKEAADGSFAEWRGSELAVAGTWIDNNDAQVEVWPLLPDAEYSAWDRDLDVAVGAIGPGESWAEAADGAYDERWRRSLEKIESLWNDRERGQLYLRFAHEMNGSWYPWKVTAGQEADFRAAWQRYRALQLDVLPDAELVFSVNRESVDTGTDWRDFFPGEDQVDVLAVDYYNQHPHVTTDAQWKKTLRETDRWGAPKGLLAHQEFAREQGLPFALSEWGNNAEFGESPLFIRRMRAFFEQNAGDGPGEVLYEVYFNPADVEDGKWSVWPKTLQPASARAYRKAF